MWAKPEAEQPPRSTVLTPVPQYWHQSRALALEAPLVQQLRAGEIIILVPTRNPALDLLW